MPGTWFASAVQTATGTLHDNRDLVRMPFFPRPVAAGRDYRQPLRPLFVRFPVLIVLLLLEGIWRGVLSFSCHLTLAFATLICAAGALMRDV